MTRPIDVVRAVAPLAKPNYIAAFQNCSALLVQHEIITPLRLAHFLAQILHESGELRIEWENMNYSAERMLEIFGASHSAKVKPAEAAMLAHKPELIAERVYGLGNPSKAAELGNTHRGDGFLYRGGGLMQTTGRANYKRMGQLCGVDFESHPELVVSAEHALKPALGEWSQGKLNQFADQDDVLSISKAINLGNPRSPRTPIGLAERRRLLAKVKSVIGDVVTLTDAPADTPDLESAMDLLEIKRRLREKELYRGEINRDYDRATDEAVKAWLLNQGVRNFEEWPELRLIIAAAQALCRAEGIDTGAIDGRLGPQTRSAFEIYAARRANGGAALEAVALFRDETDAAAVPAAAAAVPAAAAAAPPAGGPSLRWPTESDVEQFFGPPGSNQVLLQLPFPMRLAWDLDTVIRRASCNAKVRDSLDRIWTRVLQTYGLDEIRRLRLDLFGGCLNVRRKRGGSGWSMHAFGIAWDVDPDHNQLKMGRDEATLDGAEYNDFWNIVYDEGAIGLGRERNFDWMHFQFARLG
ncbi:hypothetical protein [Bradyrhizobium sp. BWA-3-5]|uniref:hypothetical protein n=1 Tax=Bradyrhizobium sp. BWA-3-5 TaxID=3080013 RepID=UPI00293E42FA|nr:hypothetical protein [Bradyrhizobium sp. BWA-3-5]WOH66888.1 hypothetical protein RX331_03630 [Bradyrhizobium sp. BWA-3-5]